MCHFLVTSFCFDEYMEPKEWLKQKEYGISAYALKQLIHQAKKEEMEMLKALNPNEVYDYMISKLNFCQRKQAYNYKEILPQIRIRKGDICFIDFGQAYLMEIGYQHFGLILAFKHHKALVVPMTGKPIRKMKSHLFALGEIPGLYKESCLFLNDAKWINTARIIDVKGHIDPKGKQFQQILKCVCECIGAFQKG